MGGAISSALSRALSCALSRAFSRTLSCALSCAVSRAVSCALSCAVSHQSRERRVWVAAAHNAEHRARCEQQHHAPRAKEREGRAVGRLATTSRLGLRPLLWVDQILQQEHECAGREGGRHEQRQSQVDEPVGGRRGCSLRAGVGVSSNDGIHCTRARRS